VLDGILPGCSFPEVAFATVYSITDQRLLGNYFRNKVPGTCSDAQQAAVAGVQNAATIYTDTVYNGAMRIAPSTYCPGMLPATQRYNAAANPSGARCDIYDHAVNVYGRDPTTDFARRLPNRAAHQRRRAEGHSHHRLPRLRRRPGHRRHPPALSLVLDADTAGGTQHAKVVRNKPATLQEGCMTRAAAPTKIVEKMERTGGQCAALYPAPASPRFVAGASIAADVIKCQLKAPAAGDYVPVFTAAQQARLASVFPASVCDWN
jgi:hypothetical protein